MHLKGYESAEIEQRARHTGDAIKRYSAGFSKVILFSRKDYTPHSNPAPVNLRSSGLKLAMNFANCGVFAVSR